MNQKSWGIVLRRNHGSTIVRRCVTYWDALQCGAIIRRYLHDIEYDVKFLK
ncbi:MAG: hypothetical protein PUP90_02325 [Nostoc sp. S4]|nr:hypothetical protein [Nostoc sp. S4]